MPKNAAKVNYRKPGFLSKFLELNAVMWNTNAGLTERHNWDSRPSSWPRLARGIVRPSLLPYDHLRQCADYATAIVELLGEGPQADLPRRQPVRLVVEHG